jgi:hypothetical protein
MARTGKRGCHNDSFARSAFAQLVVWQFMSPDDVSSLRRAVAELIKNDMNQEIAGGSSAAAHFTFQTVVEPNLGILTAFIP